MPTPIWSVEHSGDKLIFERPREFRQWWTAQKPGRYELTVRQRRNPLSRNARGYLHLALKIFANESGRTLAEMKALCKLKLLWDGESVDKAGLPIVPSTEELDSKQYAEFTDGVRRLAAECSIYIPNPNEVEA